MAVSRSFWRCCCCSVLVLAHAAGVVLGESVSTNSTRYNAGELGHRPHLEFKSSREYAPLLQVNVWNTDATAATDSSSNSNSSPGSHIFLRHDGNASSPLSSPLILDARDLSAVYMNRTFHNVFGTRVQEDRGRRYLTFWAGDKGDGIGDGYGLAFDDAYRLVYKVSAQHISHDVHADLHEFAFTGDGTALVTGVDRIRVRGDDLRDRYGWDYGFPAGLEIDLLDGVFQEIDLDTNEVLFDWRALDHVNPLDSYEQMGMGWDTYHINSIEKTQAGNYLISIRHTHSIHLIDGQTGAIIWTLGGAQNDFIEEEQEEFATSTDSPSSLPQPLLTMAWQHHARFVPGTNESQLTFFDNHVKTTTHGECRANCSRGLHIALNTTATPPTAQLLRQFLHPARLQAQSQGSVQLLAPPPSSPSSATNTVSGSGSTSSSDLGGNVFIGWGRCPGFTEHAASGETVLNVQFSPWHSADIPDALDNYRAYKMDWVAEPWWDPAIAVAEIQGEEEGANGATASSSELVIYVSWNGATEVARWVVRGRGEGEDEDQDVVLATSPRTGFETRLAIPSGKDSQYRYLWAEALGERGNLLRSSEVIDLDSTSTSVLKEEDSDSWAAYDELELKPSWFFLDKNNNTQPTTHTKPHVRGLSSTAVALLGAGLGVLVLTLTIGSGVVVWIRRRRNSEYNSLKASDFDLGPIDEDDDDSDDEIHGENGVANGPGDHDDGLDQSTVGADEDRQGLLRSK
ncbi:ASST-domain-containing protein [Aspergillus pseudoustus]|uniref:ASST-domain-containing protein n=1 Tax=Aspergillus pseudoustus TaxID=1810923 RepID=A0ABR4INK4_9EURO